MNFFIKALVLGLTISLLAGCGIRGKLYLPTEPNDTPPESKEQNDSSY
jgi:predicted small lipoprotein YifL